MFRLEIPKLARALQEVRGGSTNKENHMGWTRNYPLLMRAGAAVLFLFSLVAAAAMTGTLSAGSPDRSGNTAKAVAARKSACRNCGVVVWVRTVEVDTAKNRGAKQTGHSVTVRMDDGSERTLSQAAAPSFSVGARVRVNGNALERG
jgi:outer membrane lipoprotein SlyB